jgi:pilus assembly protein Flp/PilA
MEAPMKKGQGMVEYALILVLVALVIFIALTLFGSGVGNLYQTIVNKI